jgi:hypothetical protein
VSGGHASEIRAMTEIWKEPGYAKPVSELRKMTDEQLEEEHDTAFVSGTPVGADYYLDELARRAAGRQADRIEALTDQMVKLTKTIQWLAVASLGAVLLSVVVSVIVAASS